MTSQRSTLGAPLEAGPEPESSRAEANAASESPLDAGVVEELTRRLPTAELVKIIKGALECGRRNQPFTESDLLRVGAQHASASPLNGTHARLGRHRAPVPAKNFTFASGLDLRFQA